ncbi:MAG: hypothetical protein QOE52_2884 [Mycobacterium sp.]|jgi:hypothetical protein|nr:hypothetical protein [Mycobacterium sp.]MDT5251650.1 hypothetical protein [Mycobacterium sp.]MDT5309931.1 hypothetical protein [Mycobacterium sp.]MDT5343700.1 hypothetical protein [Mycobacterium sp.]MDT7737882.1 hypothetical protein [Mycobacterium sp.]
MRAVLPRVFGLPRRGRSRPAHAMPSAKRTSRTGIRNPENRPRHAGDIRVRIAETSCDRPDMAEIQTSRVPEPGIASFATRSSVRHWHARAVRTRLFKVALISCLCLVIARGLSVTPLPHPTAQPTVRGTSLTPGRPTVSLPRPSGPRLNAVNQPPTAAAPQTGHVTAKPAEVPGHDLSLDVQGLPAAPDDPELEAALSDLDRQAGLDHSMREQHGLGEPPVAAPGPPVAPPPDGKPPGA